MWTYTVNNSNFNLNQEAKMGTVKKMLLAISMAVLLGHTHNTYADGIDKTGINADMVNKRLPGSVGTLRLPTGNYLWPINGASVDPNFVGMLKARIPSDDTDIAVNTIGTGIKQFHWVIDYCVRSDNGDLVPTATDSLQPKGEPDAAAGEIKNNVAFRCPVPTSSPPTTPPTTGYYHIPVSIGMTVVMNSALKVTDVYPTPGLPTGKLYQFAGGWEQKKRFMPVMELPTFVNTNSDSVVNFASVCREGGVAVGDFRNLDDNRYARVVELETSVEDNEKELATQKIDCGSGEGLYEFEPTVASEQVKVKFEQFTDATRLNTQPKAFDDLRLNVFNVGDGNCAILQCPGDTDAIMFDCGSTQSGAIQTPVKAKDTPVFALKRRKKELHFEGRYLEILNGVNNIHMVVSHPDGDHFDLLTTMIDRSTSLPAQSDLDPDPIFESKQLADILYRKLRSVYMGGDFFNKLPANKTFLAVLADIQKRQDSAVGIKPFTFYSSQLDDSGNAPKIGNAVFRGDRFVVNQITKRRKLIPPPAYSFKETRRLDRYSDGSNKSMFPLAVSCGTGNTAEVDIMAANAPFTKNRGKSTEQGKRFSDHTDYTYQVNELLKRMDKAPESNSSSIVTRITFAGRTILLTADAGYEAVAEAMGHSPLTENAGYTTAVDYDLLSAQHHGSDNDYHYVGNSPKYADFRESDKISISRLMLQSANVQRGYKFPHTRAIDDFKPTNLVKKNTDRTYRQSDAAYSNYPEELKHRLDYKETKNVEYGETETFNTGEHGDLVIDIKPPPGAGAGKGVFKMNCVGPFGYNDGLNYTGLNKEDSKRKRLARSRWCRP
jgi:beta-lactamase superfamily II metal-dependent hydrolase